MFNLINTKTGKIIDSDSDFGNIAEHHMVACEMHGPVMHIVEDEDIFILENDTSSFMFADTNSGEGMFVVGVDLDGEVVDLKGFLPKEEARGVWKDLTSKGFTRVSL